MDKAYLEKTYKDVSDCDLIRMIKVSSVPENIRNEATHALWHRYELQTYKMQHALEHRIRENKGLRGIDMEGFFSGAYEGAFLKAVAGVKIEKIVSEKEEQKIRAQMKNASEEEIKEAIEAKRQKWKFYKGYQFYLQNYTNRDVVGNYLKKAGRDIQSSVFTSEDGEDFSENINSRAPRHGNNITEQSCEGADVQFLEDENKRIFWNAVDSTLQKLNRKQLVIWNMRNQGEKKRDIAARTRMTSSELNSELRVMKSIFDSELAIQEKKAGMKFELKS